MRIMPKIIHDPLNPSEGIELPTVPPDEWIATVEKLVGQSLNKAEKAYAAALAEHYNWTAKIAADHLKLNRAAPDLLEACERTWRGLEDVQGAERLRALVGAAIALAQGGAQ